MVLCKEYRIPLPLTVDEYRIAQLYMIAKKSRMESHSAESGVQILVNEPYTDGPGPTGAGQYTRKVYYIASHLPGWLKALIPKSALTVEEEAWNAYPYTKTRYTCSIVDKFSIEVETVYHNDSGAQENVFNLTKAERKQVESDVIDVVRDQLYGADYLEAEDPTLFVSSKTGRGPLLDNWIQEYWEACQGKETPLPDGRAVMCAYKLCKVEFRYWGMQTKIEKFIHDVALRKTMLRAHRQAWAWQDEWWGLTIEDVRAIEEETMAILQQKYATEEADEGEEDDEAKGSVDDLTNSNTGSPVRSSNINDVVAASNNSAAAVVANNNQVVAGATNDSNHNVGEETSGGEAVGASSRQRQTSPRVRVSSEGSEAPPRSGVHVLVSRDDSCFASAGSGLPFRSGKGSPYLGGVRTAGFPEWAGSSESLQPDHLSSSSANLSNNRRPSWSRSVSKNTLSSQSQVSWRMESIRRDSYSDESGEEDDLFFDCPEHIGGSSSCLNKWNSMEQMTSDLSTPERGAPTPPPEPQQQQELPSSLSDEPHTPERLFPLTGCPDTPNRLRPSSSPLPHCPTCILVVVLHAGSVLETPTECSSKGSDLATFRHAFECVVRQHYPVLAGGGVAFRLLPVDTVTAPALQILVNLSGNSGGDGWVPVGALPVIAEGTTQYQEAVASTAVALQTCYREFLASPEGVGFTGHVCLVGDCVAGLLLYDLLCVATPPSRPDDLGEAMEEVGGVSGGDTGGGGGGKGPPLTRQLSEQSCLGHPSSELPRRRGSWGSRLEYEACDVFLLGCPLGLLLLKRQMHAPPHTLPPAPARPHCHQLYNLFHPTDPLALRLEPLFAPRMAALPPVTIPRYTKHPLGDSQPTHLLEYIQRQYIPFCDAVTTTGAAGNSLATGSSSGGGGQQRRCSDASLTSNVSGLADTQALASGAALREVWWGSKRLDYALYCPDGLANFPPNSLPHLFHASFWESNDVAAFILRQVVRSSRCGLPGDRELPSFAPTNPREKWIKKRTSVKLKNVNANHRGNDVIVRVGAAQVLHARFMYGPLDMVALSGEKVDVHIMRSPPAGEWTSLCSQLTDKTGRLTLAIPPQLELPVGIYPVRMVVRGDHTGCTLWLAVVPPGTQLVVFSIDGSLTASVSVSGKDPKVRPGAVDVLRVWQQRGYLLLYVTGRPDLQQHKVLTWLAKHNFPHGLVSFVDGITTDPLGHKATFLKTLIQDQGVVLQAAYGSAKDISVYSGLGLSPDQIYVVGKASKKQHTQAQVLADGYSAHLSRLSELLRPVQVCPQLALTRSFCSPSTGASVRGHRIWASSSVSSSPCSRRGADGRY